MGSLARSLARFTIVSSLLEFDELTPKPEREREREVRFVDRFYVPHENHGTFFNGSCS